MKKNYFNKPMTFFLIQLRPRKERGLHSWHKLRQAKMLNTVRDGRSQNTQSGAVDQIRHPSRPSEKQII